MIHRAHKGRSLIMAGVTLIVFFGMTVGIFFSTMQHSAMASPCGGMKNAACPLKQLGTINNPVMLVASHAMSTPHHATVPLIALLSALAFLFTARQSAPIVQRIRKRSFFLLVYHRYLHALHTGTIHSKLYA